MEAGDVSPCVGNLQGYLLACLLDDVVALA